MAKKKKQMKHIDLNKIENPEFVKSLSYKELDVFCHDVRTYLLDKISETGGHLSSNLGVVESTVALCKVFDFSKDKIIFDVGHQCYTYKLLTGRDLNKLRQKDGISGFQKISESPYDHYEAGHSSTSISAANGMAVARDLNKENYDVIAFIGDASISNGLALEGLNNIAEDDHKVIIVLNDNEMSISLNVGGFSRAFRRFASSKLYTRTRNAYEKVMKKTKLGTHMFSFTARIKNWFKRHLVQMTLFDSLGYKVIGPVDGHDVKKLTEAFSKAKRIDKSVIVYVKTIKGKGYRYSEKDQDGTWHGVGKFDVETGKINETPNQVKWSEHYASEILEAMNKNEKAYTIVPGTAYGSCLKKVFDFYPNRCKDVGIAEEHAVVFAGGLSVSGYHPIISMYSTFLQRAYDEISHDLARMNLNATLLIDRAGLVGQDGNTHQGIYDEGYLYSIPNTVITMASKPEQSHSLMMESLNNRGVFAIRYPRGGFTNHFIKNEEIPFATWLKQEDTLKQTCIIGVGPNVELLKEELELANKSATIVKAIYLKPVDENMLKDLLDYKTIIIYDAYSTINGFVSFTASRLMELGYKGKVILKACPDTFVDQASVKEQEEKFGLTPKQIVELV